MLPQLSVGVAGESNSGCDAYPLRDVPAQRRLLLPDYATTQVVGLPTADERGAWSTGPRDNSGLAVAEMNNARARECAPLRPGGYSQRAEMLCGMRLDL